MNNLLKNIIVAINPLSSDEDLISNNKLLETQLKKNEFTVK
jgi:hypothetical protein